MRVVFSQMDSSVVQLLLLCFMVFYLALTQFNLPQQHLHTYHGNNPSTLASALNPNPPQINLLHSRYGSSHGYGAEAVLHLLLPMEEGGRILSFSIPTDIALLHSLSQSWSSVMDLQVYDLELKTTFHFFFSNPGGKENVVKGSKAVFGPWINNNCSQKFSLVPVTSTDGPRFFTDEGKKSLTCFPCSFGAGIIAAALFNSIRKSSPKAINSYQPVTRPQHQPSYGCVNSDKWSKFPCCVLMGNMTDETSSYPAAVCNRAHDDPQNSKASFTLWVVELVGQNVNNESPPKVNISKLNDGENPASVRAHFQAIFSGPSSQYSCALGIAFQGTSAQQSFLYGAFASKTTTFSSV